MPTPVEEKVLEIFNNIALCSEEITLQTKFGDLDSLDVVEGIMELEEEYGLEIDDESADRFNCAQDVVDYLKRAGK